MSETVAGLPRADRFVDLFTPKLVTTLREGYSLASLRSDAIAGLTVAVVALPLAMAIAIASGVGPERGLFTAIVAGFIISALGGSRFQIGGPTAAFIVVVNSVVIEHGYDGLALATLIAGVILIVLGLLRLGSYIKYIPYPVIVGFTAGIAVSILASQLRDLFGLEGDLPAAFLPKLAAVWELLPTLNPIAVGIAAGSIVTILALRRWLPKMPGFLIAVVGSALLVAVLGLPVDTIGTRFGAVPSVLPAPALPTFSLEKLAAVMPAALTIALLAGVESLLSAVVADGMTGRRHRSNCELVAQGIANIGSVAFGGISATGAIARTATNIRAGGRTPVAGMLHAVFLLLFMLVAAPALSYVPLAALAAILAVVAWNIAEVDHVRTLLAGAGWGDKVVLTLTFLLTVLVDLTVAIEVGVVLAAFMFMHRMAEAVSSGSAFHLIENDIADVPGEKPDYDVAELPPGVGVYRIGGPFFFGAADRISTTLGRIGNRPSVLIIDFAAVPFVDATAATALKTIATRAERGGGRLIFSSVCPPVRRTLRGLGLKPPLVVFSASVPAAVASAQGYMRPAHA